MNEPTQKHKQLAERILRSLCPVCGGDGCIDSGGVSPWSSNITLPCEVCADPIGDKELEAVAQVLADAQAEERGVLQQLWKKIHRESSDVICIDPACEQCAATKQLNELLK